MPAMWTGHAKCFCIANKLSSSQADRRTEAAIAAVAAAHAGSVFGLFLLRAASLGALWLAFSLAYHLSLPSTATCT